MLFADSDGTYNIRTRPSNTHLITMEMAVQKGSGAFIMLETATKGTINVKSTPSNRHVGTLSDGDTDNIEGKDASNDISWRDIGAVLDHFFLVSMGTLITVFTTGSLIALTTGTSDFQGHVHH